ncbi:MAG: hypothetical protein ACTSVE_01620 [Candidatus Helarchaeota archaeon]
MQKHTLCDKENIKIFLHFKDEIGNYTYKPCSARKKPKKRSKIEVLFVIAKENFK